MRPQLGPLRLFLGLGSAGCDAPRFAQGLGEARQGRPQQAQFADAGGGRQHFAKRRSRPAATRECGIQHGMTRRRIGR